MGLCLNIASFFYIDNQFPETAEMKVIGKIISIKEEKEYKDKYIVKILDNEKNYNIKNYNIKNTKVIIYTMKENNHLPGDIVTIKGIFSKPETKRNYGGFDYRKYLKGQKIYGIIEVEEIAKIGEKKDVICVIQNIRLSFLNKIDKLYKKENAEFLKSLLLGKTDGLSEKIEENFRDSSISHVLAISGMHVSYVVIGLKGIFEKFIKSKKSRNFLLIIILIIFAILTGGALSCVRACIMGSMVLIASNVNRKNNFYVSFIFSLLIIILYNPYNIYNTGMWLSYMGTLGIVLLYSFLKKYFYHKLKLKRKCVVKNIFSIILKNIFENFLVTISAQILIFPIMMYVFNTISISFFISNILISFFIGPILIWGYISIFFSYIIFPISKIIVLLEEVLIFLVLKISEICAILPFSKIYVITPSFVSIVSYYLIILFLVYKFYINKIYLIKLLISYSFFKNELIKKLKKISKKIINLSQNNLNLFQKRKSVIPKRNIVVIILIFVLTQYFLFQDNKILQINFVDVGQGDCTYIKTPNGKKIVIDGGEGNSEKYDYGEKVLLPYLLDKGVKKVDFLIVSHADSDHIGGLFTVLENVKVDKILIGVQPETSKQFTDLLEIAQKKKIEIIILKAGNEFIVDEDIKFEVLWPMENNFIQENALNNNSLVLKLLFYNFSCIFTGDIEEVAEKQIIEFYKNSKVLNSTILKVAHHGSKSSSISSFIEKVNPKISLIGVGKNNNFGHPNEEVLERLENYGSKIYRTDKDGEISIFVDKDGKIKINTIFE